MTVLLATAPYFYGSIYTLIPAIFKSICNNLIRFIKLPEVTTKMSLVKISMQIIKDSKRSRIEILNRDFMTDF
jgi:hypothetical protein